MNDDIEDPMLLNVDDVLAPTPVAKKHPSQGPAPRREGRIYSDVDPITGGPLGEKDDGWLDPEHPREDGWRRNYHLWTPTKGTPSASIAGQRRAAAGVKKRQQNAVDKALGGEVRKLTLAATPTKVRSVTKTLRDLGLDVAADTLEDLKPEDIARLARASVVLMLAGILSGEHEIKGAKEAITIADSCLKIARLEEGKTTENFDDGSSRTIVTRSDGSRVITIRDASGSSEERFPVSPAYELQVQAFECDVRGERSLLPDGEDSLYTVAVTNAVLQAIDERRIVTLKV